MKVTLRTARPEDAESCGRICYEAFKAINDQHGFPPDFPFPEVAVGFLSMIIPHPGYHVVVAESGGQIIGSNAVDLRGPIAGIGPITVDPKVQNSGAGRLLMHHVIDQAQQKGCAGVRLVQAAFHCRSLSLYTKLGFDAQEPLSCVQGSPLDLKIPGYNVRSATAADADACNAVALRVHGHTRDGELREAIEQGSATLVEHQGRISGYASGMAFFAHAVGATNNEIKALIGAAPGFIGPGILVPTRNADLLRWCLKQGLRVVQPLTLMSMGLYNQPSGAFLPSISY